MASHRVRAGQYYIELTGHSVEADTRYTHCTSLYIYDTHHIH